MSQKTIAILGAGNLGCSIAEGLADAGTFDVKNIWMTRRRIDKLDSFKEKGYRVTRNNLEAVSSADILLIAVEPHQLDALLKEIEQDLDANQHTVISVVSGASIETIEKQTPKGTAIARAMPNTAIAIRESMTCICSREKNGKAIDITTEIFETVGETQVILEEQMTAATALCACGVAFFLRAIRAASQGGIEIGFHSQESLQMAAQTAKGAASLLAAMKQHPEFEIDKVTTPMGCTISGLNQLEHGGFSSAMIRGILTSAEKAGKLY